MFLYEVISLTFSAPEKDALINLYDFNATVIKKIKGKILAAAGGDTEDDTRKVARWSLVPSESSDAYRQASLEIISAGQMVRKIDMANVFVVDYIEEYGNQAGTGTFMLKIKQKKEKVKEVAIEGGYASQEA